MRRIISKYERNKKKKRNQLIVGGILIFIMFFSVVGYSFQGQGSEKAEKINYNGFEFVKQNSLWFTGKGNLNFVFRYNPKEVETINSELKYLNDYYGEPLYIYSENTDAELEIYQNLDQVAQRMQRACLKEDECDKDSPIKSCADNFIIIKESNNTGIIQEENCVFIRGPQENLVKISDEFLFQILGIRG